MDNDTLLKKKILETANKAFTQNIYTYTNFLSIQELSIYNNMLTDLSFIHSESFGGSSSCERQIIQFGSEKEFGYEGNYPITLLKISPLLKKFADDLNHRDFLGALMNLGIQRNLIGDIIIKDNVGFVFCMSHISQFIIDNLTKIKHTNVKCEISQDSLSQLSAELKDLEILCASARVDAVVSSITKSSRSKSIEYFRAQKIFVNGKTMENNSYILKSEDVLVIRGIGKFIYCGCGNETKKGRVYIKLKQYV